MGDPHKPEPDRELTERIAAMSRGKKIVLIVFIIWAIQAIPKWTAAIVADRAADVAEAREAIEFLLVERHLGRRRGFWQFLLERWQEPRRHGPG